MSLALTAPFAPLSQAERHEKFAPTVEGRYHLCFALGKALEDRRNFEASFRYYERGNALMKSKSHYQPEFVERNAALQKRVCHRSFLTAVGALAARHQIRSSSSDCRVPARLCRVLRVQYEEVVKDLEGNVRRILDYCGLDFEPGCLEFHRTERGVRTASSEQVRQPLFKEGLDQWRHYEPWLDSLRAALEAS